jgi:hypothetical protein
LESDIPATTPDPSPLTFYPELYTLSFQPVLLQGNWPFIDKAV